MSPVLIAGAGPTGLTAAMELSRFGMPVRLIERAARNRRPLPDERIPVIHEALEATGALARPTRNS